MENFGTYPTIEALKNEIPGFKSFFLPAFMDDSQGLIVGMAPNGAGFVTDGSNIITSINLHDLFSKNKRLLNMYLDDDYRLYLIERILLETGNA